MIAVSPTLDDHGLAPLAAVKRIPKSRVVYLAAAKDDAPSVTACDTFAPLIKNLKGYHRAETGGHGLSLFGAGLVREIPEWLHVSVLTPSLAAQGLLPGGAPARK